MSANHALKRTDSNRLLRRIRETLGGVSRSAQEKLDHLVQIIAYEMHSEVCSAYIKSVGNMLILFATQGLNPLSVQYTRLRMGEGVIGDVAANGRPLVLSDIKTHPAFSYRPETGEDLLHGFLGVPIYRDGRVLGVLALQTKEKRLYTYDEVDLLQTISMVIAELISSREFLQIEPLAIKEGVSWIPTELYGFSLNAGIAKGIAVFHQNFPSYSRRIASTVFDEKRRLQVALVAMQMSLKALFSREDLNNSGDHQDVFETYRMLAFDRGWQHRMNEFVEKGFSAEDAVENVLQQIKMMMSKTGENFWSARVADLEDLSHRLIQFLSGQNNRLQPTQMQDKIILIAKSMGPAELLDYEIGSVAGLIIEEGMQSSHVAIVAKALNIPLVAKIPGLLFKIEPGDYVILDGDAGKVIVKPGSRILSTYNKKILQKSQQAQHIKNILKTPALTKDGIHIHLKMNAGLPMDVERLHDLGLESVGLYRTEIPFMQEKTLPTVFSQQILYKDILAKAKGLPVIFRTLDLGGDKLVPYMEMPKAENPAMDWRAIRISLDRPAVFRFQIRALLQAAAGQDLYIMIPMVTTTHEVIQARKLIDREIEIIKTKKSTLPTSIKIGAMVEVPSLAYELDILLNYVDFISVGTNDLLQFFYATDRTNMLLNKLYDPISPGFLKFLKNIRLTCAEKKVPVHICGEIASSPLDAMVLLGIGYRNLSISPAAVGSIKSMIRSLNLNDFQVYMERLIKMSSNNLRNNCLAYAQDHGVII